MRPEPTALDWLDHLELSHDRFLMLFQVDSDNLDDPPKLLLEEFDSWRDFENCKAGGSVWLFPEDLPRLIAWLEKWLRAYQECAEEDKSKSPV